MALQTSGPISLNDMHVEVGGTSGTLCSVNDADIRDLISRGANTSQNFQEYYGKSAETSLPTSGSTVNGQVQLKQITASSYISSGGTLRVPSNMWVWSDSRTVAALIIDIPCTVVNDGKIIGKGGNGAYYGYSPHGHYSATTGGPAINVTSSGVTITNSSGAYIAGGGGGGGHRADGGDPQDSNAGGGGGAGGGVGGGARQYFPGGAGGTLNADGGDSYHAQTGALLLTSGGGAGGAGGGVGYGGGGGGRKLPGVGGKNGGFYATGSTLSGGFEICEGGSAGNVGHGPNPVGGYYSDMAAGGGGWGARGGHGSRSNGAAGGAAITGTARTLSNSGTIYGST